MMHNATDGIHPIDAGVRSRIVECLRAIEVQHEVRVLFACESGSRGWGFASPDSDYDVRFIYVHRLPWYLRVEPGRDVIELPIDDELDVSGWELRKTLGLVRGGNATPAEWLDSPVVYRENAVFMERMADALRVTCQPSRVFHHYLHMALRQWQRGQAGETVRLKRYFYVLRPLLAALWIDREASWPPMPFPELLDAMVEDVAVRNAIETLLMHKRDAVEAREGERVGAIDAFIASRLQQLQERGVARAVTTPDFAPLDELICDFVVGGGEVAVHY